MFLTCHKIVLEKANQIMEHNKPLAEDRWYGEKRPPDSLCDKPNGTGFVCVNMTVPSSIHHIPSVHASVPRVRPGGYWRPVNCTSRSRLAVVIPYRDRYDNLKRMLQHLHPFLQRQMIEYQMFVVEPVRSRTFNRGFLKNIGFLEAINSDNFDCVVFQLLTANAFATTPLSPCGAGRPLAWRRLGGQALLHAAIPAGPLRGVASSAAPSQS